MALGTPGKLAKLRFLTHVELHQKFDTLTAPVLGEGRTGRLDEALLTIDVAGNLSAITRLGSPTLGAMLAID